MAGIPTANEFVALHGVPTDDDDVEEVGKEEDEDLEVELEGDEENLDETKDVQSLFMTEFRHHKNAYYQEKLGFGRITEYLCYCPNYVFMRLFSALFFARWWRNTFMRYSGYCRTTSAGVPRGDGKINFRTFQ